jgi:hypothetical protein
MMRRIVCCALLAIGCGPALGPLLAGHHHRETVCAAVDGNAHDRARVGRALDVDADIHANVRVISDDELPEDIALPMRHRVRLVRVVAQSNVLPLDEVVMTASFVTNDGRLVALEAGWESLAWATQEHLPPRRPGENWITVGNLLRTGAMFASVGVSLLFMDFPNMAFRPETIMVDAPLHEYQRLAPRASVLMTTARQGGCERQATAESAGGRCVWYFVLDLIGRDAAFLQVDVRYVSRRLVLRA